MSEGIEVELGNHDRPRGSQALDGWANIGGFKWLEDVTGGGGMRAKGKVVIFYPIWKTGQRASVLTGLDAAVNVGRLFERSRVELKYRVERLGVLQPIEACLDKLDRSRTAGPDIIG